MTRVGLLGGTFDPIHNGHLQLAEAAVRTCGMDRILFIPAGHPPHKSEAIVCDIAHRLQMLKLGIEGIKYFGISEIEIRRQTPSFTIDTIRRLHERSGPDIENYFIIGFDAMLEIETWYRWQELLGSTDFIVAIRPGFSLEQIENLLARNGFYRDPQKGDCWVHGIRDNLIRFLMDPIVDVSSTEIRQRMKDNRRWHHLVPEPVSSYIEKHNLYGSGKNCSPTA
jgi:nicotinate-nucleotide adenylyltransferase